MSQLCKMIDVVIYNLFQTRTCYNHNVCINDTIMAMHVACLGAPAIQEDTMTKEGCDIPRSSDWTACPEACSCFRKYLQMAW